MSEASPNPYQAPTPIGEPSIAAAAGAQHPLLDGRLATTGLGLKFIYWGILLFLLAWICVLPMGLVMTVFESQPIAELLYQWVYLGTSLLALGLLNLGPFLCLSVPRGYGLRPFAVATVIGIVLFWVSALTAGLITTALPLLASVVFYIVLFLSFAMFLAFLYRLSGVIGRNDLTRRCRNVAIVGSIVLTFSLAASMMAISATTFSGLWVVWPIATVLGGLLFFVAYANVINALANAIRNPGVQKRTSGIL